jgi:hypothetical protein
MPQLQVRQVPYMCNSSESEKWYQPQAVLVLLVVYTVPLTLLARLLQSAPTLHPYPLATPLSISHTSLANQKTSTLAHLLLVAE